MHLHLRTDTVHSGTCKTLIPGFFLPAVHCGARPAPVPVPGGGRGAPGLGLVLGRGGQPLLGAPPALVVGLQPLAGQLEQVRDVVVAVDALALLLDLLLHRLRGEKDGTKMMHTFGRTYEIEYSSLVQQ